MVLPLTVPKTASADLAFIAKSRSSKLPRAFGRTSNVWQCVDTVHSRLSPPPPPQVAARRSTRCSEKNVMESSLTTSQRPPTTPALSPPCIACSRLSAAEARRTSSPESAQRQPSLVSAKSVTELRSAASEAAFSATSQSMGRRRRSRWPASNV
ncbi:hypothetical protein P43SY_011324 [Pythium insidiosum]|uniref:Uncharacterized protein n=1 Tax=Pythium insidiosum TaxID=114742 RepID=A0AAD5L9S5_PYTIN|nr:hypothetical protein P43SY_011324 [Pythium insidiosum]